MKLHALCALGALVVLSPFASAATQAGASRYDRFVTNYYQNPQPDHFLQEVHSMAREGTLSPAEKVAERIGFFATVMAQNPQHVNHWLSETSTLPEQDRRLLAAAAWQAGHARGARLLREMSQSSKDEVRQEISALLRDGSTPIADTPVLSKSSMDLHWGAFLASGDDRHVLAVLNAFGSGEQSLSSSARFSLAQNAARHERVMQVVRSQLDKQPEALREELRAALNSASGKQNNGS